MTSTLQRSETPVRFRTTVIRQIVSALRDVIDTGLYDLDFRTGVNIVPTYPLSEIEYPAIVVNFQDRAIRNAGVGHVEEFRDPFGTMRQWQHSFFQGTFEFTVVALSPITRDLLADALIEILRFSNLSYSPMLNAFFQRMVGEVPGIPTLFQIAINTDEVDGGGTSTSIAPWQPEDALLHEATYTVEVMGGFYNTLYSYPAQYISNVIIDPRVETALEADFPGTSNNNEFSMVVDYFDAGTVIGKSVLIIPPIHVDKGKVIGQAVIASVDHSNFHDAGKVIGNAVISSRRAIFDSATAIGIAVISSNEVYTSGEPTQVTPSTWVSIGV